MKLQKQLSRKVGKKKYPKYVVTIPPKQIEKLGWRAGEELAGKISGKGFVITRKKKSEAKSPNSYFSP